MQWTPTITLVTSAITVESRWQQIEYVNELVSIITEQHFITFMIHDDEYLDICMDKKVYNVFIVDSYQAFRLNRIRF